MKILLIILSFSAMLIGLPIGQNYSALNEEIDKISSHLTVEEKIPLYHFVMSTHNKIVSAFSANEVRSNSINSIKNETLEVLSQLYENNSKITSEDIDNVKQAYIKMIQDSEVSIAQDSDFKIIGESSYIMLAIVSIISLLIGLLISYLMVKYSNGDNIDPSITNELEIKNRELSRKIISLESKVSFIK